MATDRKPVTALVPAEPHVIVMDGRTDKKLFAAIAVGAVKAGVAFLQAQLGNLPAPEQRPLQLPSNDNDVMTADEVAAFLGVDRNTVYDYAGRGVIPHQRLGKRMLFRRGALVTWLDKSLGERSR